MGKTYEQGSVLTGGHGTIRVGVGVYTLSSFTPIPNHFTTLIAAEDGSIVTNITTGDWKDGVEGAPNATHALVFTGEFTGFEITAGSFYLYPRRSG